MKIQRVQLAEHQYSWLVLGDNYLPVKQIQEFIRYLENIERSPNTIRAYAHHLKLYWEYLYSIGTDWNEVKLDNFANFLSWLRQHHHNIIPLNPQEAKRTESTVNTILSALSSFYSFHHQLGNTNIELINTSTTYTRRYKPLLHHISKSKPIKTHLIKLKKTKTLPKTLSQDQVKQLINACQSLRNKFLISLLYESCMRIGQALGLRHSDVKSWDNEIHIHPRKNNENSARTKTNSPYIIHVSSALMASYTRFILRECEDISSDYVFVQTSKNHSPGKPLNYRAVRDLFNRLKRKVGFHVTPHMLRHTHATDLIRSGWDSSYVQRRLGHSSVQTTINIYAHLNNDDLKKAFHDYQKLKETKNEN